MPHQLIQTEDGSITLYVPELNEHYHSVHGAIQESIHIFIRAGLDFYLTSPEHRPPTEVPLSNPDQRPAADPGSFAMLHDAPWDCGEQITPLFHLHKYRTDFRSIQFQARFDIVYFDAFNPEVQPHLWTPEVFSRFAQALKPGGILVTYCVKGIVKQALREVGFTLKRLPGPPGKREMLRATKPDRI